MAETVANETRVCGQGWEFLRRAAALIGHGNASRITLKAGDYTVADFSATTAAVFLLAHPKAFLGALIALLFSSLSVEVVRPPRDA